MGIFSQPQFHNEDAARAHFEKLRWPHGVVCPHCGTIGRAYARTRPGLYRCAEKECRKDFTVTTKSVMESSHIPLHKWALGFHLMASSKKGFSAHQLHRTLEITYRSAWFMAHRLREAVRAGGLEPPLGGNGGIVEADETYHGRIAEPRARTTSGRPFTKSGKAANKRPILALVERGGRVRTFHVPVADKETVTKIVRENIARESKLHTDESKLYFGSDEHFTEHETVKHSADEYVRYKTIETPDGPKTEKIHTNSAEGYFSVFKRGMRCVYQHCAEKHLHRYLAEYDFRHNHRTALGFNDTERAALAIQGAGGKRLTYRLPYRKGFLRASEAVHPLA